jgi:mannose-6-phosphate isomerase
MYLGPLTFKEVLKAKPWGGRAMARIAGKILPPGGPIGESWEVADRPRGMSVVDGGPCKGRRLRWLMRLHGRALLGYAPRGRRFPLLVKLLDANKKLSVQVHPDDRLARSMQLRGPGKTEAWYVIQARTNARIISGIKSRRAAAKLRELTQAGELGDHLRVVTPRTGETWLCPAGTVHAIGPGVVLLEIQQNSDSTFRLYDWGRMGLDGKPRPLHLEESIRAVGGRALSIRAGGRRALKAAPFPAERLIQCDKFVIDRWRVSKPVARLGAGAFEILYVVSGAGALDDAKWPPLALRRGRTVLVPACVRTYRIIPRRALTLVRAAEPR